MNNRRRQIKKTVSDETFIVDSLQKISKAVYERLTDTENAMPSALEKLAAELVKSGSVPAHMTLEERNFFWRCLTCVRGGEELTEEEFFELATMQK